MRKIVLLLMMMFAITSAKVDITSSNLDSNNYDKANCRQMDRTGWPTGVCVALCDNDELKGKDLACALNMVGSVCMDKYRGKRKFYSRGDFQNCQGKGTEALIADYEKSPEYRKKKQDREMRKRRGDKDWYK